MNTKVDLIRLGSVSKETKGLWGTRIESGGYPSFKFEWPKEPSRKTP